jgi:Bardet-Biedl syndrome 7 protein
MSTAQVLFRTLPTQQRIEAIALGGALGTVQDKVFAASGNQVRGYTRKGKQFFTIDTKMTEPIRLL